MPEFSARQPTQIDPVTAWAVLTDAPLKGLAFAREAGSILAWDEGSQLYLIDTLGQHRSMARAPGRVIAGAISDNGALVVLLGEGGRLLFLNGDLETVTERQAPPDATTVAIDPHGRFAAVSSKIRSVHFYTRSGRPAGRFEPRQALAHLCFVPSAPVLLASALSGYLTAFQLDPTGSSQLDAEENWDERLMSNVGRLTTTGDGGMVLASCFIHGVQRFDLNGRNEGAYHLGGTAAHAVPDFAGRMIAVATVEGELAVLNSAGNVRWRSKLARPALVLETDPLGRFLIYGYSTGEIVRLDLYGGEARAAESGGVASAPVPSSAAGAGRAGVGAIRAPAWSVPVANTEEQAETAVLAVLDEPPRIAVFISPGKLQIFDADGKKLVQAPDVGGVGRDLRTAPGWIVGASDRQIVLCNARRNTALRLDLPLTEVTHLVAQPDSFGLALVQERDRLGRTTIAGRWVWKRELDLPVEELAVGPHGYLAVTTEDGGLRVFDPAGEPAGAVRADPPEPLCLIDAPDSAPKSVVWITLARRAQVLRGHDLTGRTVWQSPVPFEGWTLQRLGPLALIAAPDGRALAYDGQGHLHAQGRASDGSRDVFTVSRRGGPLRLSRQDVHLICSDLDGRVQWRTVAHEPLGPLAAGAPGVAILIGRALSWFPSPPD